MPKIHTPNTPPPPELPEGGADVPDTIPGQRKARQAPINLSQSVCERAKPDPSKRIYLWDARLPGFCMRIEPTGRKSFWVKLSKVKKIADGTKHNEQTWFKLGDFYDVPGGLTLDAARTEAAGLRHKHSRGGDVRALREEERFPVDLRDAVAVYLRNRKFLDLAPKTQKDYKSFIRNWITDAGADTEQIQGIESRSGRKVFRGLERRYLRDLDSHDFRRTLDMVEDTAGKPTRNRVASILSAILGVAETEKLGPPGWRNPLTGIPVAPQIPRRRILTVRELASVGRALRSPDIPEIPADAIRFLALSGLRLTECLGLTWDQINLERGEMRFEDHKTSRLSGTKTIPLSMPLRAILKRRESDRATAWHGNRFVFRGAKRAGHLTNTDGPWNRIRVEAQLTEDSWAGKATLHDFRRTYCSVVVDLGYPAWVADKLTGHSLGRVQETYLNPATAGILAEAAEETARWVEAAMDGREVELGRKVRNE